MLAALVLMWWGSKVQTALPEPTAPTEDEPGLPRSFYWFISGNFLGLLVFTQLFAGIPLYTVELLHRSEAHTGVLFSINTVLVLLLEAPITQATLGWSLPRALALGQLLQGLGTGVMALLPDYRGCRLWCGLVHFREMLQAPACPAYVNRAVSPARLGFGQLLASGKRQCGLHHRPTADGLLFGPTRRSHPLDYRGLLRTGGGRLDDDSKRPRA